MRRGFNPRTAVDVIRDYEGDEFAEGVATGAVKNTPQKKTYWYRTGALWKPKPGSKAKATGHFIHMGMRRRFAVFPNPDKRPGDNRPDYLMMSCEPAEEGSR